MLAVAVLSALAAGSSAEPWHWELAAGNILAGSGVEPGQGRAPVYYHGVAATAAECQLDCGTNTSCRSFAWASGPRHAAATTGTGAVAIPGPSQSSCPFTRQCFFRTDSAWDPVDRPAAACHWAAGRKVAGPSPSPSPPSRLKNVLYVMVDDLRAQLGCYGHNATVLTPHVDRLAATGTLFRHAYVQIAVCSPSRTSFLTGLRPQQSNVLNFVTDFRRATPDGPGIVTLPAYFKAAGVLATGIGKTYHPGLPAGYDEPASWSPDFPYVTAPAGSSACPRDTSPWCSDGPDVADDDYADGVLVTEAIRQLGVINATYRVAGAGPAPSGSNPLSRAFFMAVGLHRPHMDWVVPPSFLARQPPPADIKLAEHPRFPNATPAWAFYNCTELTRRARLAGQKIEPETPLPPAIGQTIRRNYYAAVEYMDSQVGRLLDGLERLGLTDSTAVVFHGDHGWKLGELGQWCKETVFENDARSPLLIRSPWIASSVGRIVGEVVELIDVFVTLADLSGLTGAAVPLPPALEGKSLAPLLRGAPANTSAAAFSTYPRWKQYDDHGHCTRPYSEIEAIALSVRTAGWRFTDWVAWDAANVRPDTTRVLASELYDHAGDDGMANALDGFEITNLATSTAHSEIVAALRARLGRNFGAWPARGNASTLATGGLL